MRMIGNPEEVVTTYLNSEDERLQEQEQRRLLTDSQTQFRRLRVEKLTLFNQSDEETRGFSLGDDLRVRMDYRTHGRVQRPHFVIKIHSITHGGPLLVADMLIDDQAPAYLEGTGTVECVFRSIPLLQGRYRLSLAVFGEISLSKIVFPPLIQLFSVKTSWKDTTSDKKEALGAVARRLGAVYSPYEWIYS